MTEFTILNYVRAEMNAILDKVSDDGFLAIIKSTLSVFEYQGLNVLGIVKKVYHRGTAAGKSKAAIQSDVSSMILLFLSRGNNIDKMVLRTNEVGKLRITTLKSVYKLANNVGREGNTVITLSRIAAVSPVVTLKLLGTDGANIPRAVTLSGTDFGSGFPRTMQTMLTPKWCGEQVECIDNNAHHSNYSKFNPEAKHYYL